MDLEFTVTVSCPCCHTNGFHDAKGIYTDLSDAPEDTIVCCDHCASTYTLAELYQYAAEDLGDIENELCRRVEEELFR